MSGKTVLREVNAYNKDAINKAAFMPEETEEETLFSSDDSVEKPAKKHTGKLVEVNKGNKVGINKRRENLFFDGGNSFLQNPFLKGADNSTLTNPELFYGRKLEGTPPTPTFNMGSAVDRTKALGNAKFMVENFKNKATEIKEKAGFTSSNKANFGSTMQTIGAAALPMLGQIGKSEENPNGLFDIMDPLHHLAGGRQSGVGNTMGSLGVGVFQAGAQSGNPWLMVGGAALKGVGSLVNAAFGIKENKQLKDVADASIAANRNFMSNASSFDDIKGPTSMTNTNIYEDGWFTSRGEEKNRQYAQDMANAYSWADRSINNNVRNLVADQSENFMRNYAALGGYFDRSKRKKRLRRR